MKFKTLALLIILLISSLTYSQFEDDPGFGSGDGDPATEPVQTPIDHIIIPLLITGIITTIYFIKKKEKQLY